MKIIASIFLYIAEILAVSAVNVALMRKEYDIGVVLIVALVLTAVAVLLAI